MIKPAKPLRPSDVAGHYDELDRFYRDVWGDHVHHGYWIDGRESPLEAVEQLVDHVASNLDLSSGQDVLDVGCGYGATSRRLAERHDVSVTGLTISPAQHRYAQQVTEDPRVTIVLQDWMRNEIEPESVDRVVSLECVSHVEDKAGFFREISRVLKPGGRAVVIAWLTAESPSQHEVRHYLEPICREGRLPSMASQTEYEDWIRSVGLKQTSFEDLTLQVQKTWAICMRRVGWRFLSRPSYWWFLISGASRHTIFLVTLMRIMLSYQNGAMRYGMFVIERAPVENSSAL